MGILNSNMSVQPQQQGQQQQTGQNTEIVNKYNEIKNKYTIYFQKALELEDQLREHSLVGNTLATIEKNRRCWRTIGGVIVEKDLDTVKKDLDGQIFNIKQTLELVHRTLKTQEGVMKDFEKKYADVLNLNKTQQNETKKQEAKSTGGLLV